ncbi:hypothetical protein [Marinimicrobium sp. ABcell2]|uniref:hypothetical protein n=1 Tax=Marinimicrobium sp. ABcell2 TaxID=3069751 RepID=UPI0027B792DF|nr:hypothetical protein [Marinimicrobium sp. ABcell2]MDQ2075912.1 hypothetical protein [Marinimicrobium sp. ABcell2]
MGDAPKNRPFAEPPPWLEEEALPRRLLERFLTKLEKGQQRLSLRINPKTAPQLYDFQNEDVSFLWALIKSLDKEYQILTVKPARVRPGEEPYENAQLVFMPDKEELVRHWLNRPALDPYALVWQHTLAKMANRFEDGGDALAERMVRVPEQGAEKTLRAFARIGEELQQPQTLRTLSARCFWGDSKFLERHEDLVGMLFPSLAHNLIPRPILMSVYLPQRLEKVLFIENQDSFIGLAHQELPNCALVYSAGFRGSALRIRDAGNAVFSYLNPGDHGEVLQQFRDWWFNTAEEGYATDIKTRFWGDLDFSGMAILKALRLIFPDIDAWEPGYTPMLERLRQGEGHAHDSSGKHLQKDPGNTGCDFADRELLPTIRTTELFVDQEVVGF